MKHKIFYLIVAAILFSACSTTDPEFIYYTYKNVTITRLDDGNKICFYYGKYHDETNLPSEYIKASYKGFDGGMGGYLIFKIDRTVEVRRTFDAFESIGKQKELILNDTITNIHFAPWMDSIRGNYNNVIQVSDVIEVEKRLNKQNNSFIKAIYPAQ